MAVSLGRCWGFFSDPNNLGELMPEGLGFEVLSEGVERVYGGQMIDYLVRPVFGLKMRWLTEISHVEERVRFVDEQRVGPYRLWHHEHHFEAVEGGVMMTDLIHYGIGWGVLGRVVNHFMVRRQLEEVFDYRREKVAEIFGGG